MMEPKNDILSLSLGELENNLEYLHCFLSRVIGDFQTTHNLRFDLRYTKLMVMRGNALVEEYCRRRDHDEDFAEYKRAFFETCMSGLPIEALEDMV